MRRPLCAALLMLSPTVFATDRYCQTDRGTWTAECEDSEGYIWTGEFDNLGDAMQFCNGLIVPPSEDTLAFLDKYVDTFTTDSESDKADTNSHSRK